MRFFARYWNYKFFTSRPLANIKKQSTMYIFKMLKFVNSLSPSIKLKKTANIQDKYETRRPPVVGHCAKWPDDSSDDNILRNSMVVTISNLFCSSDSSQAAMLGPSSAAQRIKITSLVDILNFSDFALALVLILLPHQGFKEIPSFLPGFLPSDHRFTDSQIKRSYT